MLIRRVLNRSNIVLKAQVLQCSDDMLGPNCLLLLFLTYLVGFRGYQSDKLHGAVAESVAEVLGGIELTSDLFEDFVDNLLDRS